MTQTTIYTARIEGVGTVFDAPETMTVLQAVELAHTANLTDYITAHVATIPALPLSSSCRNGTCRTCICQLINGEVTYQIDWPGLSADERRDGFILPCVAYPASDLVIRLPNEAQAASDTTVNKAMPITHLK